VSAATVSAMQLTAQQPQALLSALNLICHPVRLELPLRPESPLYRQACVAFVACVAIIKPSLLMWPA